MHVVDIYRDNLFLFGVKPDNDSVHIKRVMGENELRLNFIETQYILFQIGDKATVFGETFYINTLPVVTKSFEVSTPGYKYQMILQGTVHSLSRVQYLFLGDDNSLKEGEFSLTGTAADFLDLVIQNSKRLPEFTYSIQQTIDDGYRTLTFSSENCLEALIKIAEAFNTEYWVEGTEISLTKKQTDTGYTFQHGKRKGLYEIIRQTVNNESVVTRLYAFGSDKNLPEGYRNYSKRLKLPFTPMKGVTNLTWAIFDHGDGTQSYTFTFDTIVTGFALSTIQILSREIGSTTGFGNPSTALTTVNPRVYTTAVGDYEFIFRVSYPAGVVYNSPVVQAIASTTQPALYFAGEVIYLEKNIDLYGVREATKFFDEVYPHRTGTVTSVNGADPFEFSDASMDFNLNSQLLPGMTAKVTFNSGQLTGYTFEVSSYDNTLKRFIILQNKNERAQDVPSIDLRPAIGDKYVIVDIFLPQSYIDTAEAELQTKAQAHLDIVSQPQLTYQLIFDPVYLKEQNRTLHIGDMIWVIDAPLQIENKIRVISVQRNIVNEWEHTLEISNTLPKRTLASLISGQNNTRIELSTVSRNIQNNAVLNQRIIGPIYYRDLPVFADNAAAIAGGLTVGQAYKQVSGGVFIVE